METPDIPGAETVVAWFGYWPTFHDAEVLSIVLDRSGPSTVAVHVFESTSEVEADGYYRLIKHAVATFSIGEFYPDHEGVTDTRIDFLNHQNVLQSAWIEKTPQGHLLRLAGIFGVDAFLSCRDLKVMIEAANPDGTRCEPRTN